MANKVYQMLDGKQQEQALVATAAAPRRPSPSAAARATFPGIAVAELAERPEEGAAEGAA